MVVEPGHQRKVVGPGPLKQVIARWLWTFTSPGITMQPEASTTSRAVIEQEREGGPVEQRGSSHCGSPMIGLSRIRPSGAIVRSLPPVIQDIGFSWSVFMENHHGKIRRRFAQYAVRNSIKDHEDEFLDTLFQKHIKFPAQMMLAWVAEPGRHKGLKIPRSLRLCGFDSPQAPSVTLLGFFLCLLSPLLMKK